MRLRTTRTYAILEISPEAYGEIRNELIAAGYSHALMNDGCIDMDGLAVAASAETAEPEENEEARLP